MRTLAPEFDAKQSTHRDAQALGLGCPPSSAVPTTVLLHRRVRSVIGTTLGRYRIDAALGSGGMGTVYRATVVGDVAGLARGTTVALKVLHEGLVGTPGFVERFRREGELGRRVAHPNVVATFDADLVETAVGTRLLLAMEYVDGQTLRGLLRELGRVPEALSRHVARAVASALSAMHAAGVAHRDIKPDNVLITRENVVKVMDLGLARPMDGTERLSVTGVFAGSLHYAAPEQFRDAAAIDGRTDLYALGATLYELATGAPPFEAEGFARVMGKVLAEAPWPVSQRNPDVSPFFDAIVLKLLAKDPAERFASADDLIRVLDDDEASDWWMSHFATARTAARRRRRPRTARETELHGREAELATLSSRFERAKAGSGQVVLVAGEAGVGKTRLVEEFVERVERAGEEIHFLAGAYPPGGAATGTSAFETAFLEQFGGGPGLIAIVAGYLPDAPWLAPALAALLRGDAASPTAEPLTPESTRLALVQATRCLAAERPTIVLIDDLHFAPAEGRALFAALAVAAARERLLLIGTTRPGLDPDWTSAMLRLGATSLPLGRLGAKDVARVLVEALRSERTAEQLAYKVILKSDGNPFYVFEILRALRDARFLAQDESGAWTRSRPIEEITIPSSILELVRARLAELSTEERELLDVASCCGDEFDPALVASAVGAPLLPTLKRFAVVERRTGLVRSAGRHLAFDHGQVREAVYGGLHQQLREAYHEALGEALEARSDAARTGPDQFDGRLCFELAGHFLDGARGERATRYLDAALAYLERTHRVEAAIHLASRALAASGLLRDGPRCELMLRLSGHLALAGRATERESCLEDAVRLADSLHDTHLRARARTALGCHFYLVSRSDEARRLLSEAIALCRDTGDVRGEAAATGNLGAVAWTQGRHEEARACHERNLELSRSIGDGRGEAAASGNLGAACWALGRIFDARTHHERHLSLSKELGDRQAEANASGNLGVVFFAVGRYEEALAHHRRHLAIARETGNRLGEALALGNIGCVLAAMGRHEEARAELEDYLAIAREVGYRQGETNALLDLGASLAAQGMDEAAACRLRAAVQLAERFGQPGAELVAKAHLAVLPGRDRRDCLARALAAVANCEPEAEIVEAMQARHLLWTATGDRAHLAAAGQRLDELVRNAPPEDRDTMLTNVSLYRDIVIAAHDSAANPDAGAS